VKLYHVSYFVISAIAGVWWGVERNTTAQLQRRNNSLLDRTAELSRLRDEHDRLIRLQPSAEELARLRSDIAAREQEVKSTEENTPKYDAADGVSLLPGTWAPVSSWKNRGRITPAATVETILWAASGGDVNALKDSLYLSEGSRSKIEAILANLPESSDQRHASPEDLMALMVAGNVPLNSAQIVARQQSGDNEMTEYLRLRDVDGQTRLVYLSLIQGVNGWKLIVPSSAVEQIANGTETPN
jgi:hypothetical protein